jgi:hypothetical protein
MWHFEANLNFDLRGRFFKWCRVKVGRKRKVIPKTYVEVAIISRRETALYGNLKTSPIPVPGSFDEFNAAFRQWLQEYMQGPKRIRKLAKPKEKLEAGAVLAKLENLII